MVYRPSRGHLFARKRHLVRSALLSAQLSPYGDTRKRIPQAATVRPVCTRKALILSNATFYTSLPNPPAYDLWAKADHRSGKRTGIELTKTIWATHKSAHTEQVGLTTVWISPQIRHETRHHRHRRPERAHLTRRHRTVRSRMLYRHQMQHSEARTNSTGKLPPRLFLGEGGRNKTSESDISAVQRGMHALPISTTAAVDTTAKQASMAGRPSCPSAWIEASPARRNSTFTHQPPSRTPIHHRRCPRPTTDHYLPKSAHEVSDTAHRNP